MEPPRPVVYEPYEPEEPASVAAQSFHSVMSRRRSVRTFDERSVSRETIETIVQTAGTAPSGAHKQPWTFVAVQDTELKRRIRAGAEEEERLFYEERAPQRWLQDLEPFGTDASKPFLEEAPWLIVVFKHVRGAEGEQTYYVNESVGIAVGFLLTAIHYAGLVALTHTPSPMAFLTEILDRPDHEKPYLLIPVGYPSEGCVVPDLRRKPLDEILVVDPGLP